MLYTLRRCAPIVNLQFILFDQVCCQYTYNKLIPTLTIIRQPNYCRISMPYYCLVRHVSIDFALGPTPIG